MKIARMARWLPALAVICVVGCVAGCRSSGPPATGMPASLRAPLTQKVVATAEAMPADFCADGLCTVTCTADVFGIAPRHAATLDAVTSAYAQLQCDTEENGAGSGSRDVVALSFGPPPVLAAGPDDATRADLAKIFPPYALDAAWWYYTVGNG